jgi:hypothetical protein
MFRASSYGSGLYLPVFLSDTAEEHPWMFFCSVGHNLCCLHRYAWVFANSVADPATVESSRAVFIEHKYLRPPAQERPAFFQPTLANLQQDSHH